MNDILFGNNNSKVITKLSKRYFKKNKVRNLAALLAIILTAFLFTSITSLAFNMASSIQLSLQMQKGSKADGTLGYMTEEQYEQLVNSDFVEQAGHRRIIGYASNTSSHSIEINYADSVQQELTFCVPTNGAAPEKANEIATTVLALKALGVEPEIGAEVPLEFELRGKTYHYDMVLSGWWEASNDSVSVATVSEQFIKENPDVVQNTYAVDHEMSGVTFSDVVLKNKANECYTLNGQRIYKPLGFYHDWQMQVLEKYKTLEPLEAIDILIAPDNIRKKLKSENDIYKFEYCSLDEKTYKIASYIPLEWKNGKLEKVLMASMDVTQEKKAEIESRQALKEAYRSAENANRAKTEFLSNMSHDIRTPMNAIVGLTAIAGANIESQDRVIECLSKITKSSRHLLGLINEVLDMARIESGKMTLAQEDFNLPDLVDNLITLTKPVIDEHKHNLDIHINHIEHESVCGDSLRIQQVFVNLMSNAVKYTPDGGNITFSIEEKPNGFSELGCYEFTIEDNGIGMSPEFQKIMFDPFSRADDHRTTRVQGTGLGMAISRNIVNLMNGNIKVDSTLHKGTKITVTIYLELQEKEKEKDENLMNLPVLVVDDDKTCCESTVATLKEIGITGEWVLSGREAVERCYARHELKNDYFAVILDWKMPDMDGIETARQIRKRIGKEITIIVLTSYEFSEIEEDAKAAGVDAFIAKPLFRSRLTATLRQFVSDKNEKTARNYLEKLSEADYTGKRILLVEDNELNREIAVEILQMTGAEVETAENGKIAVEKVEVSPKDRYDLIFMDIQMPVLNGYQATAAIRSLPGEKGKLPIVAMTANAFAEDVQLAKNTGMNGHIAKPLDMNKLNDVLENWL